MINVLQDEMLNAIAPHTLVQFKRVDALGRVTNAQLMHN